MAGIESTAERKRVLRRTVILSSLGFAVSLSARTPGREEFHTATLVKISEGPPYCYTFEVGRDGYIGRSQKRLHLTEAAKVQIKIRRRTIFVIDDSSKVQKTIYEVQYLLPPPIPTTQPATPSQK